MTEATARDGHVHSRLILGSGFVGSVLAEWLRSRGIEVTQSSRRAGHGDVTVSDGAALDALVGSCEFDQIVVLGQLTGPDIDWVLERIDGPRWLIMSSQQVMSTVPAPGTTAALAREELAVARGACVLRPTMIFGKGRDRNVTRLIRLMELTRLPLILGSGPQLVQPLHVDDLVELIACHGREPRGGLYPVGGAEAIPVRELVSTLAEILGLRAPVIELPTGLLRAMTKAASLVKLRADQLQRLGLPKTAEWQAAGTAFGWEPAALGLRLEQAVFEVENG